MTMATMIDCAGLAAMLRGAAAQIQDHHPMLSQLDSAGGDGDHGTTILRAMNAVLKVVEGDVTAPQALLKSAGWAVMGIDGGATGPLLGMFLTGMSEAAAGKDAFDADGLAGLFESGLAKLRKQTQAQPGDKTLIDALVPAVTAARAAATGGADVVALLDQAAAAAADGAVATEEMQARFGRARNIKEKSIGAQDPGATSISLIFKGFAEGARQHA